MRCPSLVGLAVEGGDQLDGVALGQVDAVLGEAGRPHLRPREVDEHADGAALVLGRLPDPPDALHRLGRRAVGQRQAGHVHPRLDHGPQDDRVLRRGADGGDDLGPAFHGGQVTAPGALPTGSGR